MSAFCSECGHPLIGHGTVCDPVHRDPIINKYVSGFSGYLYWTVRDVIEHMQAEDERRKRSKRSKP